MSLIFRHELVHDIYKHYKFTKLRPTYSNTLVCFKIFNFIKFTFQNPNRCICVGNLGSYPGSLDRATGEKVTESEVSRVFRGTDNRQSDLGSWGPSTAREGRPKGDITSLTSEVIEGRVANGAVTWSGTALNAKLPSLGFVLNSTEFKSGQALSSRSNLALMSVCDLERSAKVELVVSDWSFKVFMLEFMLCMSLCSCCSICSCCFCCMPSDCCCICSVKVLARLSIMTTEEGLEKGLTWREVVLLPPIAPNSSLSLSCE